jgi:S-adenosylmethionine:tRNA ribosyltransferase-isomerase
MRNGHNLAVFDRIPDSMRCSDFFYALPEELIAQYPLKERTGSRLLYLDGASGRLEDRQFTELPQLLKAGDLLVFNDARVMRARLFGHKATGGKVEVLLERVLDENRALALLRASNPPKPGDRIRIDGEIELEVIERQDDLYVLHVVGSLTFAELMEHFGHIPLPPYITRAEEGLDNERYQTVYARRPGAIAAPTAGLHFDQALLKDLERKGIELGFITLYVGSGTFQPVREERIEDHRIHKEYMEVSPHLCRQAHITRARGGRIIAVGSTSVRALETAFSSGEIRPYARETGIFIYPGYQFSCVDAMITNFHLPGSTLLMLVCAFAGQENVLNAYRHAIEQRYRFFSYGDAMFVTRR